MNTNLIDVNKVIQTIGRLRGRAEVHRNAANQTSNDGKKKAHLTALEDLLSMADDLADAFDDPAYVKTVEAYRNSFNKF